MTGPTSVGVVSAWFDPLDNDWSGVTTGLVSGLQSLGLFAGVLDGAAPHRSAVTLRHWLAASRRLDDGWLLTPEAVALHSVVNAARRRRRPAAGGWVHLGAFYGRPEAGPFVTFQDRTPVQVPWGAGPPETDRRTRRLRRLQRRLYLRAAGCCAASRWTARSIVDDFGIPADKVAIVGFGNNHSFPPPATRDWQVPSLLFVGKDWRRKNGDAVVAAFAEVRRHHPSAQLHLVGDHPRVDVAGVTGHGRLRADQAEERSRLCSLFQQATMFVMPSYEEPFGIAYIEAMACGLPVVATTVGGPPDFVTDDVGELVTPGDHDALVRALVRMSDPATAARRGAAAPAVAARYTWTEVARRVVDTVTNGASAR